MDYNKFFGKTSEEVAKDLLGRLLVRNTENGTTAGEIIETGAYEEGKEIPSREGMKYAPGTIFLMPFRGYQLLNISTDKENYPSCVEIRRVRFHDKTIKGPGSITNFIDAKDLDGVVLGNELEISRDQPTDLIIRKEKGSADNCLGYFSIK